MSTGVKGCLEWGCEGVGVGVEGDSLRFGGGRTNTRCNRQLQTLIQNGAEWSPKFQKIIEESPKQVKGRGSSH